jgi:hypothetical protein
MKKSRSSLSALSTFRWKRDEAPTTNEQSTTLKLSILNADEACIPAMTPEERKRALEINLQTLNNPEMVHDITRDLDGEESPLGTETILVDTFNTLTKRGIVSDDDSRLPLGSGKESLSGAEHRDDEDNRESFKAEEYDHDVVDEDINRDREESYTREFIDGRRNKTLFVRVDQNEEDRETTADTHATYSSRPFPTSPSSVSMQRQSAFMSPVGTNKMTSTRPALRVGPVSSLVQSDYSHSSPTRYNTQETLNDKPYKPWLDISMQHNPSLLDIVYTLRSLREDATFDSALDAREAADASPRIRNQKSRTSRGFFSKLGRSMAANSKRGANNPRGDVENVDAKPKKRGRVTKIQAFSDSSAYQLNPVEERQRQDPQQNEVAKGSLNDWENLKILHLITKPLPLELNADDCASINTNSVNNVWSMENRAQEDIIAIQGVSPVEPSRIHESETQMRLVHQPVLDGAMRQRIASPIPGTITCREPIDTKADQLRRDFEELNQVAKGLRNELHALTHKGGKRRNKDKFEKEIKIFSLHQKADDELSQSTCQGNYEAQYFAKSISGSSISSGVAGDVAETNKVMRATTYGEDPVMTIDDEKSECITAVSTKEDAKILRLRSVDSIDTFQALVDGMSTAFSGGNNNTPRRPYNRRRHVATGCCA